MKFPYQSEMGALCGNPGNAARDNFNPAWLHANVVPVPVPWVMTDGRNHYGHVGFNKNFADSLERVFLSIWEAVGKSQAEIEKRRYHIFSGTAAFRNMRTHAQLSMHAFAAAIDFDAPDNALHAQRHLFQPDDVLFVKFRAEGWTCGIDWRGNSVDAMHIQAPRVG